MALRKVFSTSLFLFLLVFLCNFLLRLCYLDAQGLWHDEAFSLFNSQRDWGHIKHISEWDPNPPFYFYFMWIWRNLFGLDEFAIRLSSVIFSALAGGVLFLFAKKHFGLRAAIVVSILYFVSDIIYYYAHEARPYTLIVFFSVCSCFLFFELLEKPKLFTGLLLGVINFSLIYLHYLTAWFVFCQFAVLFFVFRSRFSRYWFLGTLLMLVFIALRFTKKTWLLLLKGSDVHWLKKPDADTIYYTLSRFFNGAGIMWVLAGLFLICVLVLISTGKFPKDNERLKILFLTLTGPLTFVVFIALSRVTPMFLDRYMLFSLVPFYLLLTRLILLSPVPAYISTGIIGILCGVSFINLDMNPRKPMDYRSMVQLVKRVQDKSTRVIVYTGDVGPLFAYYYDRRAFKNVDHLDSLLEKDHVFLAGDTLELSAKTEPWPEKTILTQTFADGQGLRPWFRRRYTNEVVIKWYDGVDIFYYYNTGPTTKKPGTECK